MCSGVGAADRNCSQWTDREYTGFTVVMEAQNERNELPLPEQNQIQMGADGSGTFDAILYTTPGDYQYHIRQLAGTDQNIEYDVTEYDVTVRVLNVEGGGLEAEVWALKSGQPDKQSRIVFHNKWKTETTPGTVTEPAQTGVKTTTMMRTPQNRWHSAAGTYML
ncbi:MAG: Spy0128 family protein [Blautia wexlerae]